MIASVFSFLKNNFYRDYLSAGVSWLVASYILGISFYFALPFEPNLRSSASAMLLACVITFASRKNYSTFNVSLIFNFFMMGVFIAGVRSASIQNTSILEPTGNVRVLGKVEKIYPLEVGKRIILSQIKTGHYKELSDNIKKVQITVKTKEIDQYKTGDYISLYASLHPVSSPLFPGSYDFARHAFFNNISANGYAVSKIKMIKRDSDLSIAHLLQRLRWTILDKINTSTMKHPGVAAALMVGEQNGIRSEVLSEMRKSGLSHILSVSGMHLTLVSIIVFFIIRYLLSHFVFFAQRYDIKKIAAWNALLITFAYLLISGLQIAAVRSFIMVACIIVGVILDREADSSRSLSLAALVILLFTPEAVLYPSFQMSFAAVLALVSTYEIYKDSTPSLESYGLFRKIARYLITITASSFIAGLATSFFVIYHFGNYSNYSVLANLLASPIVSCIIMPAVILTFLLIPFGEIYKAGLYLMDFGIDLMVKISHYISDLPKSLVVLPPISEYVLILFVVGFLWICIWKARWRFIGALPILAALIILLQAKFPSIIVDAKYKTVLIQSGNSMNALGGRRIISKKHKEQWMNLMNSDQIIKTQSTNNYTVDYEGYKLNLILENDDKNRLILNQLSLQNDFNQVTVTRDDIEKNGSYFIYLNPKDIKLKHAVNRSLNRPWHYPRSTS